MNTQERLQLARDVDRAASTLHPRTLALGYLRYEKLRLLNTHKYAELSKRNLTERIPFDDLVDELEGKQ